MAERKAAAARRALEEMRLEREAQQEKERAELHARRPSSRAGAAGAAAASRPASSKSPSRAPTAHEIHAALVAAGDDSPAPAGYLHQQARAGGAAARGAGAGGAGAGELVEFTGAPRAAPGMAPARPGSARARALHAAALLHRSAAAAPPGGGLHEHHVVALGVLGGPLQGDVVEVRERLGGGGGLLML